MSKRVTKTYGKTRKPITDSSAAFDEIMKMSPKKSSQNTTKGPFPRKSWSELSKNKDKSFTKTMKVFERSPKRRKLAPVVESNEMDPFAFDDDEGHEPSSSQSSNSSITKTVGKISAKSESVDKSTDDEAYGSSHESPRKKSPKKSPFKKFLKNNDATLSPKKPRKIKRFSVLHLPTNPAEESNTTEETTIPDDTFYIPPRMVKAASWPPLRESPEENVIRVNRQEKPLFTVVQNVKHKHECMEMGESQQFFDDMEYLLDGLKNDQPLNTRCLSTLAMASNCTTPSFRVNLRAHGVIPVLFGHLSDAPSNEMLALCTATVMFMLTQDRLNVDLDRSILELMLALLSLDKSVHIEAKAKYSKDFNKCLVRIRKLLEKQSSSGNLDLDDLSAASLARESVLSLTSQRTGEWFKEEIRVLGGLDHIIATVSCSIESINRSVKVLSCDHNHMLKRVDRCLRLLENVTYQNPDNQNYLASFQKSSLLVAIARLLKLCIKTISMTQSTRSKPVAEFSILRSALMAILKCMLNLTHDNEIGSECLGWQDGLILSVLQCSLHTPQYLPAVERFDLLVLSLGLLINMAEHSNRNIHSLVQIQTAHCSERPEDDNKEDVSAIEGLMELFLIREIAAKNSTDDMTSGLATEDEGSQEDGFKQTRDGMGWVFGDDIDITVDESREVPQAKAQIKRKETSIEDEIGVALQKAGRHMEDSMVASYVAILLGCIAKDNKANQDVIRSLLPDQNFSLLVDMLKKFLGFMKLTSGTSGHSIEKVISVLEEC